MSDVINHSLPSVHMCVCECLWAANERTRGQGRDMSFDGGTTFLSMSRPTEYCMYTD